MVPLVNAISYGISNPSRRLGLRNIVTLVVLALAALFAIGACDDFIGIPVTNATGEQIMLRVRHVDADSKLPVMPWPADRQIDEIADGPFEDGDSFEYLVTGFNFREARKPGKAMLVTAFSTDERPTILSQRMYTTAELEAGIVITLD